MNWTAKTDHDSLVRIYNKVEVVSAYILVVLSPITVFTNGAFLLALYRNTRSFRKTPTVAFIVGLSLADFLTGLFVEPAFSLHYFMKYYKPESSELLKKTELIYVIGGTISTVAISTSYVTVLAMSISQYIAVRYPHSYKSIITTKRVARLLVFSGFYFLGFSLIPYTGISRRKFLLADVILHPTLISLLLIIVHIQMRQAFKEHVSKPARTRLDTLRNQEFTDFIPQTTQSMRDVPKSPNENINNSPGLEHKQGKDHLDNGESKISNKQNIKFAGKSLKQPEVNEMEVIIPKRRTTSYQDSIGVKTNDIARRKKPPIEKQFAIISFYLSAILLVSSISHTIVFYIFLLKTPESFKENVVINIALRVTDVMLFAKVCLDAFIFAWRLPGFKTILKTSGAASNFLWITQKV